MDFQSKGLENAVHYISDVKVDTVGLVRKAAVGDNGNNFVLKKSGAKDVVETEGMMPNQADEVIVDNEKDGLSILKSIGKVLDNILGETIGDEIEDTTIEAIDEEVVKNAKPVEEDKEDGLVVEELKKAFDDKFVNIQKAFDEKLEEIQKAHDKQLTELKTVVDEKEAQLEKADAELAKSEWINKTSDIEHLPMSNEEIGAKLYELNKSADAEWVVDLLKAVDAQVKESGIFNEVGSSEQEDELDLTRKIEKAQSEGDAANALLGLSKEEQAELVKTFRG